MHPVRAVVIHTQQNSISLWLACCGEAARSARPPSRFNLTAVLCFYQHKPLVSSVVEQCFALIGAQAVLGGERDVAAPRVDIRAAAAGIASVDRQALRPAYQIVEDALDALLVEFVVVAEGNQIAQQQRFAIDLAAAVAYAPSPSPVDG